MHKQQKITILILLLPLVISTSLNTDLQPLQQVKQQPSFLNISLLPNQTYIYHSQTLAPIPHSPPCTTTLPTINITTLYSLPISSQPHIFLYNSLTSIVYALLPHTLTAYTIDSHYALNKVAHYHLTDLCHREMVLTEDEEVLFVFGCGEVLRVHCRAVLTKAEVILQHPSPLHQVVVAGELVLGVGEAGVTIWGIGVDYNLTLIQHITQFPNISTFTAQSVSYSSGRLYILDMRDNIYIFTRHNSSFEASKVLSLSSISLDGINHHIKLWENSIFIESSYDGKSYIMQLQEVDGNYDFVRFYQGYRAITYWAIRHSCLYVVFGHVMNVYLINQHPATITQVINGATTNHLDTALFIHHLYANMYVHVRERSVHLVMMNVVPPTLRCSCPREEFIVAVPIPCTQPQHQNPHYYLQCNKQLLLRLTPEPNLASSVMFLGLAFVIAVMGTVMMRLVFWRQEKLKVIEGLVGQINKLRQQKSSGRKKQQSWQTEMRQEEDPSQLHGGVQKVVIQDEPPITESQLVKDMENE